MYQAPKLEKFGTFRELTLQSGPLGKTQIGQDSAAGFGMDCNPDPQSPYACVRS